MNKSNYLSNLDRILEEIVKSENGVSKLSFNQEKAEYLEKEGFVKTVNDKYYPTSSGQIFYSKGAYTGKSKRVRRQRNLQYLFWLANIISLVTSIFFYMSSQKLQKEVLTRPIIFEMPDSLTVYDSNSDTLIIYIDSKNNSHNIAPPSTGQISY